MHTKQIGGQAVIEGVMMKSPSGWSVAVRSPKGDITHKTVKTRKLPKILTLPVLRGVVALFHALFIGIKAIEYSGNVAYQEEEKTLSAWSMGTSIAVAILLAIGLFIVLPLYATKVVGAAVQVVATNSFAFNLVDGILRVVVFLMYVSAIGLWKEMRSIYEYHGAEHKVDVAPAIAKGGRGFLIRSPDTPAADWERASHEAEAAGSLTEIVERVLR